MLVTAIGALEFYFFWCLGSGNDFFPFLIVFNVIYFFEYGKFSLNVVEWIFTLRKEIYNIKLNDI